MGFETPEKGNAMLIGCARSSADEQSRDVQRCFVAVERDGDVSRCMK